MDSLQIAIVEDEIIVSEDLRQTLEREGYKVIGCFDSAEDAIRVLSHDLPDLLMIDIRLKGSLTGIDLAVHVRKTSNTPIVYVTANSDPETYQLAKKTRPQAFLVKPFNAQTLLASVDLAMFNYSNNREAEQILETPTVERKDYQMAVTDGLFIRVAGKHKKIRLTDFLFIEADGSYIHIVTTCGRYTIAHNLSDFMRKVKFEHLLRVHRSYIVNVNKVDSFEEGYIYIDKHKIPLSKTYRGEFLSMLNSI